MRLKLLQCCKRKWHNYEIKSTFTASPNKNKSCSLWCINKLRWCSHTYIARMQHRSDPITTKCHHTGRRSPAICYRILYKRQKAGYIVQYTIVHSAFHFTPWQTCSIEHHRGFSVKYSATRQLICEDYIYTYIHQCLEPGALLYSWGNWDNVERKKVLPPSY